MAVARRQRQAVIRTLGLTRQDLDRQGKLAHYHHLLAVLFSERGDPRGHACENVDRHFAVTGQRRPILFSC